MPASFPRGRRFVPAAAAGSQSAVSLVAIDGEYISGSTQSNFIGDGYYARNSLTKATGWTGPNPLGGTFAGWDDVNFVTVQSWLTDNQINDHSTVYTRYLDLGINTMMPATTVGGYTINLVDNVTYGIGAFVIPDEFPTPSSVPVGARPAVIGVIGGEEPVDNDAFIPIRDANNAWKAATGGAGHVSYVNFSDQLLAVDITSGEAPNWVNNVDILTEDEYMFCDAYNPSSGLEDDIPYGRWEVFTRLYDFSFGLTTPATVAQTARGSNYGSQADAIRAHFTAGPTRPFGVFVETAAPVEPADSQYITPAQMKWAIFSSLVHGTRIVSYFQHSFKPDAHFSYNTWLDDYYGGPGVTGTGIYAAAKQINYQILGIASVINSPKDGYFVYGAENTSGAITQTGFLTAVTSTNARGMFGGVEAICKWQPTEHKHYILASTREQDGTTNWPVTYRMVDQGQTTAVPLFGGSNITITRGGAIPGGFCEFSDTFATAADYKCYRID